MLLEEFSREAFLKSIKDYNAETDQERAYQATILEFARAHEDPFSRDHAAAHITGSALVLNEKSNRVLLGHHRKLNRWLQLGGHGNPGEASAAQAALREAREESGLTDLTINPNVFDLDVHAIPAHGGIPEHLHLDVRYVCQQSPSEDEVGIQLKPDEHRDLRWFTWFQANKAASDTSLRRLLAKAYVVYSKPDFGQYPIYVDEYWAQSEIIRKNALEF